MPTEIIVALITVGGTLLGGALASLGTYLIYRAKHKDELTEKANGKSDNITKALRYLMLYVIQERAQELIDRGFATFEERRSLHHWHDLYHNGLGGNGDADRLMSMVDALPVPQEHGEESE